MTDIDGILALSLEILQEITVHVPLKDKKSLRASCSQMKDAVEPQLFSHICIHARIWDDLTPGLDLLEALAQGSHISKHVRTVDIAPLGSRLFLGSHFLSGKKNSIRAINDLLRLQGCLSPAVRSLKLLTKVNWITTPYDLQWTRETIIDGLSTLEHLADICVRMTGRPAYYADTPESLLAFDKLRSLRRITFAAPMPAPSIWNPVLRMIQQCPDLETLSIHNSYFQWGEPTEKENQPQALDLAQLLHATSSGKLTDLFVDGCEITPEFRNCCRDKLGGLTSLTIDRCCGDIWSVLSSEGVFPPTLGVTDLNPSMKNYIASHPGLEKIEIQQAYNDSELRGDDVTEFLSRLLPRHSQTLKQLAICRSTGELWFFGEEQAKAISNCSNLTSLKLSLPDEHEKSDKMDLVLRTIFSLTKLTHLDLLLPQYCCHRPDYTPLSNALTSYGPVGKGAFNPYLEINIDQRCYRLEPTAEDESVFRFHTTSPAPPQLLHSSSSSDYVFNIKRKRGFKALPKMIKRATLKVGRRLSSRLS